MSEKWNIKISHSPESHKDLADNDLSDYIKKNARSSEGFEVDELDKNEMEREIIFNLNLAVQSFLEKEGISDLAVDEKLVHILKEEDYIKLKKNISRDDSTEALFYQGHIYHPRIDDKLVLIRNLSHEFAHELSFLKKEVKLSKEDEKLFIDFYEEKRRGYGVATERTGTLGSGFNEAMTELASLEIMNEYSKIGNLEEKEVDVLFDKISYYPHILVLENLFEKIYPKEPQKARSLLLRGYFNGESEALKIISQKLTENGIKNGLKEFYRMDISLESALETAKYLKLDKAVKSIEEFIIEKNQ